jgi:protein TonB
MTDRNLVSSFALSSVIHVAILPVAAILMMNAKPILPPIDVSLVDVPRVEKKEPVAPPEPKKIEKVKKIEPPKLIQKTEIPKAEPKPLPVAPPLPPAPMPAAAGPDKGSIASKEPPGKAAGAEAGAGGLFGGGDVAVVPGAGVAAGGGGTANAGLGRGEKGDGSGRGGGESITQTARPLGGYQVKPRYPESARRVHAQGVTLLKVRVLENGRVGEIKVERSAGHRDLDLAASEAVKQWLFEPALRGKDPVAVWVSLPISFELH